MVVTEIIDINDKQLCKHYSNDNKYIIQVETQTEYAEAIDIMVIVGFCIFWIKSCDTYVAILNQEAVNIAE